MTYSSLRGRERSVQRRRNAGRRAAPPKEIVAGVRRVHATPEQRKTIFVHGFMEVTPQSVARTSIPSYLGRKPCALLLSPLLLRPTRGAPLPRRGSRRSISFFRSRPASPPAPPPNRASLDMSLVPNLVPGLGLERLPPPPTKVFGARKRFRERNRARVVETVDGRYCTGYYGGTR